MDFYSVYRQGFVRVAACTHHTFLADPASNAESVLGLARACHDDNVALAVFPELTLSGYSIEDILLQDALLDAVEDALLDIVVASADLLPVLVVGAPLRYRHRIYNTAVVIHRGRVLGVGAEVVPADLPGVLRTPSGGGRRRCAWVAPHRCCARAVRRGLVVRRHGYARVRAARRDL